MDNRSLYTQITSGGGGDASGDDAPVTYRKLVVVLVDENPYACDAGEVKEVVIVGEIYRIPFVPPYVAGLINRHGEPYTVLDLKALLAGEKLDSLKVLIMNHGDDQISFLISDIEKIIEVPVGEILEPPTPEAAALFSGVFTREGREVFIINPLEIYDKLGADIRNI
jgi:chemotaxis signal transduction protein